MARSRRSFALQAATAGAVLLPGCSLVGMDPADLTVDNYRGVEHTFDVRIDQQGGDAVVFDERVTVPAKEDDGWESVFSEPGTYVAHVTLDDGQDATFEWTVEDVPLGGGFRIIAEPNGELIDDVVGSP